jgi:hypothetical protein
VGSLTATGVFTMAACMAGESTTNVGAILSG